MNDKKLTNPALVKSIDLMLSSDYKDRFKAECIQLKARITSLTGMLEKYIAGTLDYVPSCSIIQLSGQLAYMEAYLNSLEEGAKIEGIDLMD